MPVNLSCEVRGDIDLCVPVNVGRVLNFTFWKICKNSWQLYCNYNLQYICSFLTSLHLEVFIKTCLWVISQFVKMKQKFSSGWETCIEAYSVIPKKLNIQGLLLVSSNWINSCCFDNKNYQMIGSRSWVLWAFTAWFPSLPLCHNFVRKPWFAWFASSLPRHCHCSVKHCQCSVHFPCNFTSVEC